LRTFAGGLFALRLKDKLHLVLGFSAGAVIGVAFFDLSRRRSNLAQVQTRRPSLVGRAWVFDLSRPGRMVLYLGRLPKTETMKSPARRCTGTLERAVSPGTVSGRHRGLASPFRSRKLLVRRDDRGPHHDFSDGINT